MTAAVRTGSPTSGASGLSLLVIPLNNAGVKRRRIKVSGLYASGSTFFEFNDVKVPAENIIGKVGDGFRMIMANFNPERFNMSIMCIRMARNAVEAAWKHALTRKTFGKPLMSHQTIRAKFGAVGYFTSCDGSRLTSWVVRWFGL
jgi:alkylation response protein AidB-like acyl-CoA dehydrogenase